MTTDAPFNGSTHSEYLYWLAARRGIVIPAGATFGLDGIHADRECVLAMPGYGASETVLVEMLDDDGNVTRRQTMVCKANGSIPLTVPKVAEWCDLPKVTKPRKARAAAPVEVATPAAAPAPEMAPASVETPAADMAPLLERLAALEAAVSGIGQRIANGKRVRPASERAAIIRAWRMRCEMRARADLDRRALLKVNADNRLILEQLHAAEQARDAARADADTALAMAEEAETARDRAQRQRSNMLEGRARTAKLLFAARREARSEHALRVSAQHSRGILEAELSRLRPVADAIAAIAGLQSPAAAPALSLAA